MKPLLRSHLVVKRFIFLLKWIEQKSPPQLHAAFIRHKAPPSLLHTAHARPLVTGTRTSMLPHVLTANLSQLTVEPRGIFRDPIG